METQQILEQAPIDTVVSVFVAACCGTAKLSSAVGAPVTLVSTSLDVPASIRALNAANHGAGVRRASSREPIAFEHGWDDWARFEMASNPLFDAGENTHGVHFAGGCIQVPLHPGTTPADFDCQLAAALRHMRFQEVVITAPYIDARRASLAHAAIQPRYTLRKTPQGLSFRGSKLVTDLIVFDPAEDAWLLLWIAVSAKLAAATGQGMWK